MGIYRCENFYYENNNKGLYISIYIDTTGNNNIRYFYLSKSGDTKAIILTRWCLLKNLFKKIDKETFKKYVIDVIDKENQYIITNYLYNEVMKEKYIDKVEEIENNEKFKQFLLEETRF